MLMNRIIGKILYFDPINKTNVTKLVIVHIIKYDSKTEVELLVSMISKLI
jgi:hypothetical protein